MQGAALGVPTTPYHYIRPQQRSGEAQQPPAALTCVLQHPAVQYCCGGAVALRTGSHGKCRCLGLLGAES